MQYFHGTYYQAQKCNLMSISERIDIQHACWAKDVIVQLTGCPDARRSYRPETGLDMFMGYEIFCKNGFPKIGVGKNIVRRPDLKSRYWYWNDTQPWTSRQIPPLSLKTFRIRCLMSIYYHERKSPKSKIPAVQQKSTIVQKHFALCGFKWKQSRGKKNKKKHVS